jgi:hypothetical protein
MPIRQERTANFFVYHFFLCIHRAASSGRFVGNEHRANLNLRTVNMTS